MDADSLVEQVGPCLTRGSITTNCVVSMWRNDIECKYMFMFPLNILAHYRTNNLSACFMAVIIYIIPENNGCNVSYIVVTSGTFCTLHLS